MVHLSPNTNPTDRHYVKFKFTKDPVSFDKRSSRASKSTTCGPTSLNLRQGQWPPALIVVALRFEIKNFPFTLVTHTLASRRPLISSPIAIQLVVQLIEYKVSFMPRPKHHSSFYSPTTRRLTLFHPFSLLQPSLIVVTMDPSVR